jgi:hypothetical protein
MLANHWSSSESSATRGTRVAFNVGSQVNTDKTSFLPVRAFRRIAL